MATKATNNLFEALSNILKQIAQNTVKWDKNTINATKNLANLGVTVTKLDTQLKDLRLRIQNEDKQRAFELTKSRERNEALQKEISLRGQLKIMVEQEHGAQVRRNIRLRESFKGMEITMGRFTSYLSGLSFKQAGSSLFGTGAGFASSFNRYNILGKEIDKLDKAILSQQTLLGTIWATGGTPDQADILELSRLQAERKERADEKGDVYEKLKPILGSKTLTELFSRLEPVVEWVKRNKTGLIISAASIGLIGTTLKKLIDSSPLLQKMLELFSLSFGLVLRPFGDFLGFVLQPLAIGLLQTVMPFFKAVYPVLMNLGQSVGMKLAKGDILGALFDMASTITWQDVLSYIFGGMNATENPEGAAGAGGLALGLGALGLGVGGLKVGKWAFNRLLGNKNILGGATNNVGGGLFNRLFGNANNQAVNNKSNGLFRNIGSSAKNIGSTLGRVIKPNMIMAGLKGGLTGFKLSNPIGWALLATELFGADVIRALSPDTYKSIQDSLAFMKVGDFDFRSLVGFGEEGTTLDWLTGNAKTPEAVQSAWAEEGTPLSDTSVQETESGFLIVMNIGTVEKDVDVKKLADEVASEVESRMKLSNKYSVG